MYRHYKVAPEPLSEEARHILAGSRDEMMSSNKGDKIMEYTKGDWALIEDEDTFQIYVPTECTVAKIHKRWGDDGEANAQLIASAPDLYEALKDIVEDRDYNHIGLRTSTTRAIQEALAKAEGK